MPTTRALMMLGVIFLTSTLFAQTSFSEQCIDLLGVKQLDNELLLVEKSKEKNALKLTLLDSATSKIWSQDVTIPRPFGYHFNKLQIFSNSSDVFVVSQLEKYTEITTLNRFSGEIDPSITRLEIKTRDLLNWVANEDGIALVETKEASAYVSRIVSNKLDSSELVNQLASEYWDGSHKVYCTKDDNVIYGGYSLEENHGEMHLSLAKYNTTTGKLKTVKQDLTLDYTSYTYNTSFDNTVVGVVQGKDAFYLIGKLDMAFKRKYPSKKVGENFIGYWVVKYSYDLEMEFFSEIPFQYFEGIIPTDVIKKAAVIDLKEDEKGGFFVVINELQGVIYGSKYIIYMDRYGIYKTITGGQDDYHFFEYDKSGLRDAGHRNSVRFMNDDWSSVGTNIFPFLEITPEEFSATANKTIKKALTNKVISEKEIFTFFHRPDGTEVILEYLKKKRGTLNIYLH